jgi:DNA-binding MarR family transcriptional regulator
VGKPNTRTQLVADATTAFAHAARLMDPLRLHVWEERGISFPQLRILFLVRNDPGNDLRTLAERLDVGTSAASQQVDRLVDRGMIERLEDPDDRRRIQLHLTPLGSEAVESISHTTREYLAGVFAQFDDEELARLTVSFEAVVEAASHAPPPPLGAARGTTPE